MDETERNEMTERYAKMRDMYGEIGDVRKTLWLLSAVTDLKSQLAYEKSKHREELDRVNQAFVIAANERLELAARLRITEAKLSQQTEIAVERDARKLRDFGLQDASSNSFRFTDASGQLTPEQATELAEKWLTEFPAVIAYMRKVRDQVVRAREALK